MKKTLRVMNLEEVIALHLVMVGGLPQFNGNFVPKPEFVKINIAIPHHVKRLMLLSSAMRQVLNNKQNRLIILNTYCLENLNINHHKVVSAIVATSLNLMVFNYLQTNKIPAISGSDSITFGCDKDWNLYVKKNNSTEQQQAMAEHEYHMLMNKMKKPKNT